MLRHGVYIPYIHPLHGLCRYALCPPTMSSLCSLPSIILERIAFETALVDPLAPPADLIPLLQSCRHIYNTLSLGHCKDLYARIFKAKFDTGAPARRFGPSAIYSQNLADQLTRYCLALKHIRTGDIFSSSILLDFWTAFIMMSENDGKNELQLEAAGLADYVECFTIERLWEDRARYNQWPAETTINALALWLMWFTTNHGMCHPESSLSSLLIPVGREAGCGVHHQTETGHGYITSVHPRFHTIPLVPCAR